MVYEWDATTRMWKRYAPNVPAYVNNLSTLGQGKAYWFLTTGAASISYTE